MKASKPKTYIQLKDSIDTPKGTEWKESPTNDEFFWAEGDIATYKESFILSKPDWFKLKEEEELNPKPTPPNWEKDFFEGYYKALSSAGYRYDTKGCRVGVKYLMQEIPKLLEQVRKEERERILKTIWSCYRDETNQEGQAWNTPLDLAIFRINNPSGNGSNKKHQLLSKSFNAGRRQGRKDTMGEIWKTYQEEVRKLTGFSVKEEEK